MLYAYTKWTRKPFPAPATLAYGGIALIVMVFGWLALTETPDRDRHPAPLEVQMAAPSRLLAPAVAQPGAPRPVYRNSVIPGGVHSAAELALALQNDAVAAAHYAGFKVAAAHLVKVEHARLVHVSYRVGDKIYWTKNTVRLEAGEFLLSDGEHLVRARCGNRIADAAQQPTLEQEPAPEVLDTLMVSADGLVDQTPYLPMVSNAGAQAPGAAQPTLTRASLGRSPSPALALPAQSSPPFLPRSAPPVAVNAPAASLPPSAPADVPGRGTDVAMPPPAATPPAAIVVPPPAPTPLPEIPMPPPFSSPTPDSPLPPTPFPLGPTTGPQPQPPGPASPAPPTEFPLGPTAGPRPEAPAAAPPAPTPVPEPGSAALAAIALAAIALVRRRAPRRRASPIDITRS